MITQKKGINYDGRTTEFYGLSTDEKPINEKVINGSTFLEIDTGSVFMFDEEGQTWVAL